MCPTKHCELDRGLKKRAFVLPFNRGVLLLNCNLYMVISVFSFFLDPANQYYNQHKILDFEKNSVRGLECPLCLEAMIRAQK